MLSLKQVQQLSAEFFGTFMLSLLVGFSEGTAIGDAPLAIGFGLVILVYATGPVSGGQLNPAVTIGLCVSQKISIVDCILYIIFQCLGSIVAGFVCYGVLNSEWSNVGYPAVADTDRRFASFVGELLQTFALASTVLGVAATRNSEGKSYFGLAIGFVVLSGAITLGTVTGGCFNPAVSMLTLLHGDFDDMWVYAAAGVLGGLFAGLFFHITNPSEFTANNMILSMFGLSNTPNAHQDSDSYTKRVSSLVMEFIGTFFLVWTVALSVNADVPSYGGLAIGAILMSMVFGGGHVSGGHYNPCVTLGMYLRGKVDEIDGILYVVIQIAAAFSAASVAAYVNNGTDKIAEPGVNDEYTDFAAFVCEFIFANMLVLSAYMACTVDKTANNSYYGAAIGWTVLSGVLSVYEISGGVFNPAIGIALPVVTATNQQDIWIYVVADLAGAVCAYGIFTLWNMDVDGNEENELHIDAILPSASSRSDPGLIGDIPKSDAL